MTTDRGLDRLTFFTDAIAAIAITLLILPLVDAVPTGSKGVVSTGSFLRDHRPEITGFLISFAVIARLWMGHHAIFEDVRAYNRSLLGLSLLWSFTVAVLPLPTAIISDLHIDRLGVAFYIGTMTLSSMALTAMSVLVARNPELQSEENPLDRHSLLNSGSTTVLFFVALILGVSVRSINLWACLLLVLSGPVVVVLTRRGRRSKVEPSAAAEEVTDAGDEQDVSNRVP